MDNKKPQRVVITGGSEGIGKGIASYFLRFPTTTILHDPRTATLR